MARKRTLAPVLALAAALAWSYAVPSSFADSVGQPMGNKSGWTPIFAEDFSGSRLDLTSWTTCYWWNNNGCTNSGNNELQWFMPGNVSVSKGLLHLKARRESVVGHEGRVFPYTSGMVTTGRDYSELPRLSRVGFLCSFFEIKARAPAAKGLWSALSLLPEDRNGKDRSDGALKMQGTFQARQCIC